ncbi:OmpA/MotB family protein [Nitrospirillum iridis]|uniref:Chemotaxis protein MotB n=1 Tax=Nitrospirillum iridis TaxID=765888 RepID=A0A7X0AVV3_9PROT|nr:OmpA family protein [Nitrospirillum iridis]MBB6250030.1 chemotaxis protein MotB [Nitrospirillum iridis]
MADFWNRVPAEGAPQAGGATVAPRVAAPPRRPKLEPFTTVSPPPEESEEWVISYMDMVTLLMIVFLGMVAILGMKGRLAPAESPMVAVARADQDCPAPAASGETGPVASVAGLEETGPVAGGAEGASPLTPGMRTMLAQLDAAGQSANLDINLTDRRLTIAIKDRILFASGKADLAARGRGLLAALAHSLGTLPGLVTIEGHTDDVAIATARFPTNWELSSARASAVVRELIADGVEPGRLRAVGYADTRPLDVHDRAANRRVTIVVER